MADSNRAECALAARSSFFLSDVATLRVYDVPNVPFSSVVTFNIISFAATASYLLSFRLSRGSLRCNRRAFPRGSLENNNKTRERDVDAHYVLYQLSGRYYTTQPSLSRDSHQGNKDISFFLLSLDSETARTKMPIEMLKAFLGMFLGGRDML